MSKKLTQAERDLARLNRSYLSLKAASDRLREGIKKDMDSASVRLSAEIGAVKQKGKAFDRLKAKLPELKFDMVGAKYFFAKDAKSGREEFAVKVSRTCSRVFRISAKDQAEALAKAKFLAVELDPGELVAEDVSIKA